MGRGRRKAGAYPMRKGSLGVGLFTQGGAVLVRSVDVRETKSIGLWKQDSHYGKGYDFTRASTGHPSPRGTRPGAIDIKEALPGALADVESEVQRRLSVLGPGGGYILAPSNHLQTDVPPENIVALYGYGRRYGRYPLN